MEHNSFISTIIILIIIAILYKLYNIELTSPDTAMAYYFVVLYILDISFNHLYFAFGESCL